MFTLNAKTKESIRKSTGIDPEELPMMAADDIDKAIEERIGKKLEVGYLDTSVLAARGSVYIHLHRLISNSWIDKMISKI